jgi:hypothetical protein
MTKQHDAPEVGAEAFAGPPKLEYFTNEAAWHEVIRAYCAKHFGTAAPTPPAPSGLVDAVQAYLVEADAYDKLGCAGKLNVVAVDAADRKHAARLALDAALAEQRSVDPLAAIAQWCEDTFGPITVERLVSRAAEEMDELRAEPHKADEVADVIINLSRYPGAWAAVQAKMAVNRGRRWRLMGDGTGYHIKPDGSTSAPRTNVAQTAALLDVVAERRRQVEAEGWTPKHDDQHQDGEMADAAACYAISSTLPRNSTLFPPGRWTWRLSDWKPAGPRRDLIKAGALILAEIERLDRLNSTMEPSNG